MINCVYCGYDDNFGKLICKNCSDGLITKTKSANKHDKQRKAQADDLTHTNHTELKITQIEKYVQTFDNNILELFSGNGKLTKIWNDYGIVTTNDNIDAYRLFHKLIWERKKYTIIDLDPYGFPTRFFPDIFLLIENGIIFITIPHPAVNVLNGITQQTFLNYYGVKKPTIEIFIEKIKQYALCHWRELTLLNIMKMGRVYRLCLNVKRVKATEYCGVRNR